MPGTPGPSSRRDYEILLGGAGGERCAVCGGGAFVRKIRYNGQISYWHQNCADKYIAALAKGPSRPVRVADPDSFPSTSNATPQKGNGASELSPEEVVLAAKTGGAEFNLFDGRTGFTIDLSRVADPVIRNVLNDTVRDNYDAILKALEGGARPPWA